MRYKTVIFTVILSLFFCGPQKIFGQKKLDKFIAGITNDKLEFEVAKVGTTSMVDSNSISLPKNLVFVKSVNVNALLSKVKREKVINALIPLLNDNSKDWYANILLYQITQKDASPLIVIENREDWIKRNKENDIHYWNNYSKN